MHTATHYRELKYADTTGTVLVPFPILKEKYIFQIKQDDTEAVLSNSTEKLLGFEITNMLNAVKKINLLCHLLRV